MTDRKTSKVRLGTCSSRTNGQVRSGQVRSGQVRSSGQSGLRGSSLQVFGSDGLGCWLLWTGSMEAFHFSLVSRLAFYYLLTTLDANLGTSLYLYIYIYLYYYIYMVCKYIYIYKSLREDNEGRRIGNVGNVGNIGIC
jgi:hypothetical protein